MRTKRHQTTNLFAIILIILGGLFFILYAKGF